MDYFNAIWPQQSKAFSLTSFIWSKSSEWFQMEEEATTWTDLNRRFSFQWWGNILTLQTTLLFWGKVDFTIIDKDFWIHKEKIADNIIFILSTCRNNMIFLELEFKYWQDNHNITVYKNGTSYSMFRYNCEDDGPRPESYFEDRTVRKNDNFDVI